MTKIMGPKPLSDWVSLFPGLKAGANNILRFIPASSSGLSASDLFSDSSKYFQPNPEIFLLSYKPNP